MFWKRLPSERPGAGYASSPLFCPKQKSAAPPRLRPFRYPVVGLTPRVPYAYAVLLYNGSRLSFDKAARIFRADALDARISSVKI